MRLWRGVSNCGHNVKDNFRPLRVRTNRRRCPGREATAAAVFSNFPVFSPAQNLYGLLPCRAAQHFSAFLMIRLTRVTCEPVKSDIRFSNTLTKLLLFFVFTATRTFSECCGTSLGRQVPRCFNKSGGKGQTAKRKVSKLQVERPAIRTTR